MGLTRRGFLGMLGAAAAGVVADPEQLLWTPGKRKLFVPPVGGWLPAQGLVYHKVYRAQDEFMQRVDVLYDWKTLRPELDTRMRWEQPFEDWVSEATVLHAGVKIVPGMVYDAARGIYALTRELGEKLGMGREQIARLRDGSYYTTHGRLEPIAPSLDDILEVNRG